MLREFMAFLKKYGVIGLAIAVVIGGKVNEFVSATVADILMPIIGVILPEENGRPGCSNSGLSNWPWAIGLAHRSIF